MMPTPTYTLTLSIKTDDREPPIRAHEIQGGNVLEVYARTPGVQGFKRRQFVRISHENREAFRYLVPNRYLKEGQLLVDWQTALDLGFDYDRIKNGEASVEIFSTNTIDYFRFILHEPHPIVRIGLISGIVSGTIVSAVFFILSLFIH